MADDFKYDVFLSHSSKDMEVVRPIAERLRKDGLRVWFDDWEICKDDPIPSTIEEGLEHSRVLVLCMSADAFGSEWARLEAGTFRFRDPLNKERRFIPLRLDKAPIKGSLAQFLFIDWLGSHQQEYPQLLAACRSQTQQLAAEEQVVRKRIEKGIFQLDYKAEISAYAFGSDGKRALSGAQDNTVRLWDVENGRCLRTLTGHVHHVSSVAWSGDQRLALSRASNDRLVRLWNLGTGRCLRTLQGHTSGVRSVVWSTDQRWALSGSWDKTIRLWNVETGRCLQVFLGHTSYVRSVGWSSDKTRILSGSHDNTVRLWDVEDGRCLRVLEGHGV